MNTWAEVGASTPRIGVIGGNSPDTNSLQLSEEMGKLIAENDFILVNGGKRGIMEASARGARLAGGLTIAILPGKERDEANPYMQVVIPTGLGYLRNGLVVLNSDVLVAIDGAYGTLSEIAYAQIYNKKTFGLNTWDIKGIIPCKDPREVIGRIKRYFGQ